MSTLSGLISSMNLTTCLYTMSVSPLLRRVSSRWWGRAIDRVGEEAVHRLPVRLVCRGVGGSGLAQPHRQHREHRHRVLILVVGEVGELAHFHLHVEVHVGAPGPA